MLQDVKRSIVPSLAGILLAMTGVHADESSEVKQSISVYGWLPSLDGTIKYTIPGDSLRPEKKGQSGIADSLDMVFMGNYELRKEKYSFMADIIYLKMSAGQSTTIRTPNHPSIPDMHVNAEQELTATMFGVYGGYNITDNGRWRVDAIGGARYFSLDMDISLSLNERGVSVSPSISNYDAVMGVRGEYTTDSQWYFPYHFDIGTGNSDLTTQASVGAGYRFGWGDVLLTYRYMHYAFGDDNFVNDFDLYGPKIGIVFHF